MQTFFKDYINLLEERHKDILEALDGLPPAALDWNPGPDMNSISVLVFHLTGAERYWIGDVAAQDPTERDRDAEFRVHDVGMDVLKKRLANNLEYARSTLNKFTIQDLETTHISQRWAYIHSGVGIAPCTRACYSPSWPDPDYSSTVGRIKGQH